MESLIVILPPSPAAGLRAAADRLTAPFVRARPEVAVHVVPAVAGVTGLASVNKLRKTIDDLICKRSALATRDPFLGISLLLAYLEGTPDLIVVPLAGKEERYAAIPTLPVLYPKVHAKGEERPQRFDRGQLEHYLEDPHGLSHVHVLFLLPAGTSKERTALCFAAGEQAAQDVTCSSVTFSFAIPMPGTLAKIADLKAAEKLAQMELMGFRMASLLLQSQHRLVLSAPQDASRS